MSHDDDNEMDYVLVLFLADYKMRRTLSRAMWRETIGLEAYRCHSGRIRRGGVPDPSSAPFVKLFNSGQDDALITLCGLTHEAFDHLLVLFEPIYWRYSPYNRSGCDMRLMPFKKKLKGNKRFVPLTA